MEGFKSFVLSEIELNNLTVLTGLNSSGKSSVIQALRIIKHSITENKISLIPGHGSVAELRNVNVSGKVLLTVFDKDNNSHSITIPGKFKKSTKLVFPKLIYVSANRFGPQSFIPIFNDLEFADSLGPNGENVLKCIELNKFNELPQELKHPEAKSYTFLTNLIEWLREISPGVDFSYELSQKSDTSYSTFNEFRANNVGSGLSFVLPVITALLMGSLEPNSMVIIENPEAHLHPKGQAAMARLIALVASLGSQVIIETHSDHIFNGLRVFAKQNEGFNEKVSLYWFELDKNKNTNDTRIELTSDGRLDNWPTSFFDQFENDLTKLL